VTNQTLELVDKEVRLRLYHLVYDTFVGETEVAEFLNSIGKVVLISEKSELFLGNRNAQACVTKCDHLDYILGLVLLFLLLLLLLGFLELLLSDRFK
jgi:hypothetical protein